MADDTTDRRCCGEGGTHAPKAGSPLAASCKLCPKAATYWRREGRTPEQGLAPNVAPLA